MNNELIDDIKDMRKALLEIEEMARTSTAFPEKLDEYYKIRGIAGGAWQWSVIALGHDDDIEPALTQQQEAEPVDWSAFPAYLIDHYEGKTIYEETLQEALSDMLRDPKYHPPKPAALPQSQSQPPESLARQFHEAYERLAPKFGYETREDTKQFDPLSNNGRLMMAVCAEIITAAQPQVPDILVAKGAIGLFEKEYIGQNGKVLWASCWQEAEQKFSAAKEEGK